MEPRRIAWKSWIVGLACGVGGVLLLGAEPAVKESGRFQLHVWYYRGTEANIGGSHGAYRIDTQSGEVYSINANNVASKVDFR
jgi:hypothetical protein